MRTIPSLDGVESLDKLQMECTVPADAQPGQTLQIRTPHGKVAITIPEGYTGGDTLSFAMPPQPPSSS